MTFSALGAVLAASLTRDMPDRERAQQLTLVGGLVGRSAVGIVMVAALVTQSRDGATPGTPGTPGTVPVRVAIPAVAGLDVDEARARLSSLGLVAEVAGASAPEAMGTVVSSEPPEATLVRTGSTVTLLVSVGSLVPDVVGTRVAEAVALVKSAGFDPDVVGVDRPDGKPDVVLSQDPDGGTYLSDGATVVLLTIKRSQEDAVAAFQRPTTTAATRADKGAKPGSGH